MMTTLSGRVSLCLFLLLFDFMGSARAMDPDALFGDRPRNATLVEYAAELYRTEGMPGLMRESRRLYEEAMGYDDEKARIACAQKGYFCAVYGLMISLLEGRELRAEQEQDYGELMGRYAELFNISDVERKRLVARMIGLFVEMRGMDAGRP